MSVVCFASLKGGVGKTTLSINVAAAFAERGCETLLIDLDPSAHATRFFFRRTMDESPLVRLIFSASQVKEDESLIDHALLKRIPMIQQVRPRLMVAPGGAELRHCLWGKGGAAFKEVFPRLIEELHASYDYIVIDTPPEYNVLTRNALAAANLVLVPVDGSAMSIDCLEELVDNSSHIDGPAWSILRGMVNRQASRLRKLSDERLNEKLSLSSPSKLQDDEEEEFDSLDLMDPDSFIDFIDRSRERGTKGNGRAAVAAQPAPVEAPANQSPIYLLNSVVHRTENQNRLSFTGNTVFDSRKTLALQTDYLSLAREIEEMLSLLAVQDELPDSADFLSLSSQVMKHSEAEPSHA